MEKPPLIAIVGPTACGKTALSIQLAHKLDGEVVAMDSMQVYRFMDIGTAKPTLTEREGISHHMLDVVDPKDSYSVAEYVRDAKVCIADIHQRGRIPILVGGTGLYLKAVTTSMALGSTQGHPAVRERLNRIADEKDGNILLHSMLVKIDPETANRLHPNDVRRVIRALEVFEITGVPFSAQKTALQEDDCPYELCILGLMMDREILYQRIENRVENMMEQGLLQEVKQLMEYGVSKDAQAMQGLGYKELIPVLNEDITLDMAVAQIKLGTRHYAKRQMTWFRRVQDILWSDSPDELLSKCFRK